MERYHQRRTCSCSSRRRGRCSAWSLMPVVMRIDYRNYRQPVVHLDGARDCRRSRWSRCCSGRASTARAAGSAWPASACSRPSSRRSPSSSSSRRVLERRMDRIDDLRLCAAADRARRSASSSALILLQPDLGTAVSILADRRRRWSSPPASTIATSSAWCWSSLPAAYIVLMSADYRRRRMAVFLEPVGGPARRRLPGHPVADRRRHRRRLRPRPDGRRAEAVLPAGAAHRLHLRGDRRGARA